MRTYPQPVQDYVNEIIDSIKEDFDSEFGIEEFRKNCSEKILEKFINGEDLVLDEDEMISVLNLTTAETILNNLKRKEIVDSIEDEHGEEIYFLTARGKQMKSFYGTAQN